MDSATLGYGALALVLLAFTWTLSALVYFAGHGRSQNGWLALFIFLEGTNSAFFVLADLLPHSREARALLVVQFMLAVPIPPVYLLFLSTIDSPLGAPFRWAAVRVLLVALAVALAGQVIIFPGMDLPNFRVAEPFGWTVDDSPVHDAFIVTYALANLFSLAVSVTALQRTKPGTQARWQIRSYLTAFVTSASSPRSWHLSPWPARPTWWTWSASR